MNHVQKGAGAALRSGSCGKFDGAPLETAADGGKGSLLTAKDCSWAAAPFRACMNTITIAFIPNGRADADETVS